MELIGVLFVLVIFIMVIWAQVRSADNTAAMRKDVAEILNLLKREVAKPKINPLEKKV